VKLLFERGAFNMSDTKRLSDIFMYYGFGLISIGTFTVLNKAFYGMNDMWTPVWVTLVSSVLYIPLIIWGAKLMGASGIAIAYGISMTIGSGLFIMGFYFRYKEKKKRSLIISFMKMLLAFCVAAFGASGVHLLFKNVSPNNIIIYLDFPLSVLIGIFAYMYVCSMLNVVTSLNSIGQKILARVR
jgi:peptidoglycan biosynthesis protein MviN/MurJ (putative lipid II flippase)